MRLFALIMLAATFVAGCATGGSPSPAREEARKVAFEAAIGVAVSRFIDGDKARAERVEVVANVLETALVEGLTVDALVAYVNEKVDLSTLDPATAELARAAIVLASLELGEYVGGTDIPMSEKAREYAKRMLAAAKRSAVAVA